MKKRYKIFIVDDEPWIILGLKKMLEKDQEEFTVVGEARNGIEALKKIKELSPDIIFSDIRMPGLDGLELAAKLKEMSSEAVIIFLSGYAEFEYAQEAIRLNAFDYLLKPIERATLHNILQKVKEQLSEKEEEDELEENETMEKVVSNRLEKILMDIEQHYMEDLSLNEVAERHGMSAGYLSTVIKKETGSNFTDHILQKRMEKAKELLKQEDFSISEVAEKVGYHDYFYFTKTFKKYTGITPSKYRR